MEDKNIKSKNASHEGWHHNTDLGCDVKTILHSDKRLQVGKEYQGVLRLDSEGIIDEFLCKDPHYTFVETLPWRTKRNPRLFNGKYISITRQEDGSLRPNFKPMPQIGATFSVDYYVFEVYRELRQALMGLIIEK